MQTIASANWATHAPANKQAFSPAVDAANRSAILQTIEAPYCAANVGTIEATVSKTNETAPWQTHSSAQHAAIDDPERSAKLAANIPTDQPALNATI